MNPVLAEILRLLDVERVEDNLYRGVNDPNSTHVFGGQVLAQAIAACHRTVDEGRSMHSMHAYFLRPGDAEHPILYDVERIRDGRSFATRRVLAIQHGKAILELSSSWQDLESGPEHATPMPDVAPPDGLTSDAERFAAIAEAHPRVKMFSYRFDAIDCRQVEGILMVDPRPREPRKHTWVRTVNRLPDSPEVHRCMLAYISDMDFMGTSLLPHDTTASSDSIQGASLDHALWFHRPFRADEWLLFAKDSPNSAGARGYVRGEFFDQAGNLVASAMQECLIRPKTSPAG